MIFTVRITAGPLGRTAVSTVIIAVLHVYCLIRTVRWITMAIYLTCLVITTAISNEIRVILINHEWFDARNVANFSLIWCTWVDDRRAAMPKILIKTKLFLICLSTCDEINNYEAIKWKVSDLIWPRARCLHMDSFGYDVVFAERIDRLQRPGEQCSRNNTCERRVKCHVCPSQFTFAAYLQRLRSVNSIRNFGSASAAAPVEFWLLLVFARTKFTVQCSFDVTLEPSVSPWSFGSDAFQHTMEPGAEWGFDCVQRRTVTIASSPRVTQPLFV